MAAFCKKNLLTGLSVDRHTLFWRWGLSKPNRTSHLNLIPWFVWARVFLCVRVCMTWVGDLDVALLGLVRQCNCIFVLPPTRPLHYTWHVGVWDMCLFKQRAGLKTMWTPTTFLHLFPNALIEFWLFCLQGYHTAKPCQSSAVSRSSYCERGAQSAARVRLKTDGKLNVGFRRAWSFSGPVGDVGLIPNVCSSVLHSLIEMVKS